MTTDVRHLSRGTKTRTALVLVSVIIFHATSTWTGWLYLAFVIVLSAVTAYLYEQKNGLKGAANVTIRSATLVVMTNALVYSLLSFSAMIQWNDQFDVGSTQGISFVNALNGLPELLLVSIICAVIGGLGGALLSALVAQSTSQLGKK